MQTSENLKPPKTKELKSKLRRDSVSSSKFHVGIELELLAPCNSDCGHDDDACHENECDNQREYLNQLSHREILMNYLSLSRDAAASLADYFNAESWVNDYMQDYSPECPGSDCSYRGSGDDVREDIRYQLKALTGNSSFKVVTDGSLDTNDGEDTDAEVCWNYFASKETQKDNVRILKWLKDYGCDFNKSCGLHINLNNYLGLKSAVKIPTRYLDYLFYFVAPSRRSSSYCSEYAISSHNKYSMLYNQDDRIEFRFFSPTLEGEKLNHYVTLAHFVYKRLMGIDCKLPKRSERYFHDKIMSVHDVDVDTANKIIAQTNSMPSYSALVEAVQKDQDAARPSLVESDDNDDNGQNELAI